MLVRCSARVGVVIALILAVGCGGGGGGGSHVSSSSGSSGASSGGSGGATKSGSTGQASGTTPPTVAITDPPRAAYLTSSPITVKGTAVATSAAVATVTVNGMPVTLSPSGDWQATVTLRTGCNTISAIATDAAGNQAQTSESVMYGTYELATSEIPTAAGSRVSQATLNKIAPSIAQAIYANSSITQQLTSQPLYNGSINVFGASAASANVTVQSVSFGLPTIAFTCKPSAIEIAVHVPNLVVNANAQGTAAFIPYNVSGDIASTDAALDATLDITLSAQGAYQVTVPTATVTLNGFSWGINGIPSFITSLVQYYVQVAIQNAVASALQKDLPPAIANALSGLAQPISRTWLGHTVTLDLAPETLAFDAAGLTVGFHANTTAAKNPAVPTVPGSVFLPPPAGQLPALGNAAGVYATLNENLLNRAAFTTWQAGFWNLTINQQFISQFNSNVSLALNANLIAQFFPQLAGMLQGSGGNLPVSVEIAPQMQPVILVVGQPNLFDLQLGEVLLNVFIDFGSGPTQVFGFDLQVDANLDIAVVNGNAVQLQIGPNPTVEADLVQSLVPLTGIDLGRFLAFFVPSALQLVSQSIQPVPIPTFQGYSLINVQIKEDGSQGEFVTISGDVQ
jgi:hypothetical protein